MSRSALQYLKTLLSMLTAEEPLHATVLRSLRRLSAAEPIRQAAGISPADMMRLINIAPTWQDQIVFRLAWMTASRWSEIYALTTDCFLDIDSNTLILDWATIPKTSKDKPYQEYRFARFLGHHQAMLRQLLRDRGPGSRLTTITGSQLRQLMIQLGKRVDPRGGLRHYTAHSIKRGALQSAAVLREEKDLDPEKVVLLAKHSFPTQISSTTLRYLQEYAVHLTGGDTMMALLADMLDV
eukprot:gene160-biopygen149